MLRQYVSKTFLTPEFLELLGDEKKSAEAYMYVHFHEGVPKGKRISDYNYIPTMIGENSIAHYRNLMITTSVLLTLIEKNKHQFTELSERVDESGISYARKDDGTVLTTGYIVSSDPAYYALVEGIVSLHQLLVLLTGSKMENITPDKVILELISPNASGQAMISRIVQKLPMAIVGPFATKGIFFNQPLRLDSKGKLKPTDKFLTFLRNVKQIQIPVVNEEVASGHSTCTGCPMLARTERDSASGVDLVSRMYFTVYNEVTQYFSIGDQR